jgi:hypothetical protein
MHKMRDLREIEKDTERNCVLHLSFVPDLPGDHSTGRALVRYKYEAESAMDCAEIYTKLRKLQRIHQHA